MERAELHEWTVEEDKLLAQSVAEALASGGTMSKGLKAAAEKIGVSFWSAEHRYRGIRRQGPGEACGDLKDALLKRAGSKGRLTAEDIEEAAKEGESGYHRALSTLGSMHRHGEVAAYRELLERVRHLVQDKKDLEGKLAAAEEKVRELEAVLNGLEEVLAA